MERDTSSVFRTNGPWSGLGIQWLSVNVPTVLPTAGERFYWTLVEENYIFFVAALDEQSTFVVERRCGGHGFSEISVCPSPPTLHPQRILTRVLASISRADVSSNTVDLSAGSVTQQTINGATGRKRFSGPKTIGTRAVHCTDRPRIGWCRGRASECDGGRAGVGMLVTTCERKQNGGGRQQVFL